MKKVLKVIGILLLVVIVGVGTLITYALVALPNVGKAPDLKVETTPEKVQRGEYLAYAVCGCMDCHSTRDWTKYSGPLVPGTVGKGGETFDKKLGFPGTYYSRNITPYGISRYSDGELYRVITTGVTKEGRAMFPVMPYTHYAKMDPEDIHCIIAYLRTLPSIENKVAESHSDFPMNIIINTIPAKAVPGKRPSPADKLAYGAYLVNASGCNECHTREKRGQIIKELEYSGGREFRFHDGSILRSSNITPDVNTGIGSWTEDVFINRFRAFADSGYVAPGVPMGSFNTIMPWTMYGKMSREDLAAIYAYLRSIPPQVNNVTKFVPATK
ncbi:hypothetical protein GCM10023093_14390 [Nemorincola caseinilytica]|uniref:Cytochrome c domain-containing protein n=1 Tax=Nemorincola caseinilytica TaxID=2054315 RepID=A0ABP8NB24_9BACT